MIRILVGVAFYCNSDKHISRNFLLQEFCNFYFSNSLQFFFLYKEQEHLVEKSLYAFC
jgi:hypothetical protein